MDGSAGDYVRLAVFVERVDGEVREIEQILMIICILFIVSISQCLCIMDKFMSI